MKVLLLNPKLKTWSPNIYPPLGLCYIASAIEHEEYDVTIMDMNSRKVSDTELAHKVSTVDAIGITGMITEYHEVIRLVELCKSANGEAKVILGGALATTHTQDVLTNSRADFVVIGEGEQTIVELLSSLVRHEGHNTVMGVAYRTNGVVNINPPRQPIKDLDTILYPARHLLDMTRYTTHHLKTFGIKMPKVKSATLITSRGCVYNCSFCFQNIWGHTWRGRSPQNIMGEIRQLHDTFGINGLVFNDDTFVCNKKRVLDFCKELIDSKLDIKWCCNGRVNLMTREMLELMKEAGCVAIAYGIESGNQKILDSINKGITLEQVEKVVGWTKQAGIHVSGYFMLGILGDSKTTINETLDFARKLDLDFYGFTMTSPIIGTQMYEQAKEQGFVAQKELQDFSFHASVNMTTDCTNEDLEAFNALAFKEFTVEKRYGKRYLFNPLLWLDGLRSVLFLLGKRDFGDLIKKVWVVLRGK